LNNQLTITTNQKLGAAKKHLSCLMHLDHEASGLLIAAYQDSIVFQLQLVCDSFVQEIASDYQLVVTKQMGFIELAALLEQKGTPCSHCTQLASLQEREHNWLSWLQRRYSQCWKATEYFSPNKALETDLLARESLISVSDISENSDEQWLRLCIDELSQLIGEYRELMQEW
jgi:hypothetical protein